MMNKLNCIALITSCSTLLLAFTGIALRYKLNIIEHRILSIIVVIGMILTLILGIKIHLKEKDND